MQPDYHHIDDTPITEVAIVLHVRGVAHQWEIEQAAEAAKRRLATHEGELREVRSIFEVGITLAAEDRL